MSLRRLVAPLLVLALLASVAPGPRAAVAAGRDMDVAAGAAELEHDDLAPSAFDKTFDLMFLRPFGVVQIVGSSLFMFIAYPVALVLGGSDELVRACWRDPVRRTFQRPLGRL